MLGSSLQSTPSNTLVSTQARDIPDDILFSLGDDKDQVLLNRSSTLTANTALTGVLIGTPVTPALAANSLIIANATADGDILLAVNDGGNSKGLVHLDGSTGLLNFPLGASILGQNELRFYEGANYVGFEAPALSADQIWVLPSADGTANQVLKTDGSGNLGWVSTGGATTALDNLASVAINTSLISDTANTDDLGSDAIPWRTAYLSTSLVFDQATRNVTITASEPATSARTYNIPDFGANDSFVGLAATQELTNKTLNASVAKGTWTASGTWQIPAVTLGGAVSGNAQTISNANVTVGASRTLDVSAGTLTLAADQISGDKVEGGTINAITINTLTLGTAVTGADKPFNDIGDMTFHAGSILASGSTNGNTLLLAANDTTFITLTTGATDTMGLGAWTAGGAIDFNNENMTNVDIDSGAIDGVTIGGSAAPTVTDLGTVTTCDINGGTIDGVTIGGAAAPTVTDLGTVTTCDINGGTIGGVTLDGDITVGEVGIKLDGVIGTDQKWSGITVAGTLGETVALGEIVMLQSDDKWDKAQADSEANGYGMLGICLDGGNDTDSTTILLQGFYRDDTAFEFANGGQPLYLSDTTAGDFITTKPDTTNDIVRIVGYVGYTKEEVYFNPDGAYVTIA